MLSLVNLKNCGLSSLRLNAISYSPAKERSLHVIEHAENHGMQNLWRKLNSRNGVLPELPLMGLLSPPGSLGLPNDANGFGVVALGPVGIVVLLGVGFVSGTKRLSWDEPLTAALEGFAL